MFLCLLCVFVLEELKKIKDNYLNQIKQIDNLDKLESLKKEVLGPQGALTLILRSLSDLPPEKRKKIGRQANQLKDDFQERYEEKREDIKKKIFARKEEEEEIDISLPGKEVSQGQLHPLTKMARKIKGIFEKLGFSIFETSQIETDFYNFESLNIPPEHPARDMWDTFWLKQDRLLLRTHTTAAQVRYMQKNNPPFRIIMPGRCFRYEKPDATHGFQFYNLDGLMVGKEVTVANFKAVMDQFFRQLFGSSEYRMRPGYFPFVEPGFELDLPCQKCTQGDSQNRRKGPCPLCKGTGWVEIMGAGMVHPLVFEKAGYVPDQWQGFAFGMGVDRLAMAAYNIPDNRLLYNGRVVKLRSARE